jgi:hypothetical protein
MATPPASRRKLALFLAVGLVALALVVTVFTVGRGDDGPAAEAAPSSAAVTASLPQPAVDTTYKIRGPGRAVVTWLHGDFSMQESDAALPWSMTIKQGSGPVRGVSAQRKSEASGAIECDVLQGGHVIANSTSTGPQATVVCPQV